MKVYKYRSGGDFFDRDLNSIRDNYFFASNAENLNDPCETLVYSDKIKQESKILNRFFGKTINVDLNNFNETLDDLVSSKKKLGIYSLSKTYSDELLWAHYANNHKGFCIEYDYDTLLNKMTFSNFYPLKVDYLKEPPQIELNDMHSKDNTLVFKKIAGTKSIRWDYEEEIRIITDKFGEQDYDYKAVTAIYFGYRMSDKDKDKIMFTLRGRDVNYFQIALKEKSYSFIREKVNDKYLDSEKYLLKFIRKEGTKVKSIIDYRIIEQKYHMAFNKGSLTIQLDYKLTESELEKLGEELKTKLFRRAETVYIFYVLSKIKMNNSAWAITHFEKDKKTISILGVKIEKEKQYLDIIKNDMRNTIGHWIDETFPNSLITLFNKDGKVYLETLFSDNTKLVEEQIINKVKGGTKYKGISNEHGEYIIVNKQGILNYYSENGLFNEIKKTTYNT